MGLVEDSKPWVGWGCALADFDNDGWPDVFVANGHIDDNRKDLAPTLSYPEPPLLYRNVPAACAAPTGGTRRFELSTRDAGPYFATRHVARGAAFGDIDDDGDIDIVVNHMDAAPAILRNDTPGENRWVRLILVGSRSNRDAIGARVEVVAGGRTITRQRKGGMQHAVDQRPAATDRPGRGPGGRTADHPLAFGHGQHPRAPVAGHGLPDRRASGG